MKTINVTFDDKEYNILIKRKRETSWHDYILSGSTLIKPTTPVNSDGFVNDLNKKKEVDKDGERSNTL